MYFYFLFSLCALNTLVGGALVFAGKDGLAALLFSLTATSGLVGFVFFNPVQTYFVAKFSGFLYLGSVIGACSWGFYRGK